MATVEHHAPTSVIVRPAGLPEDLSAPWNIGKLRRTWGIAAGVLTALSVIGFILALNAKDAHLEKTAFMRAYLVGFMWCLGGSLGCLALLMIQHVTGGKWGLVMRRLFEAGSRSIWFVAILFIPIAITCKTLDGFYPWMWGGGTFHGQHATHVREHYLNFPAWIARAIFFFLSWGAISVVLNRWSRLQDEKFESFDAYEKLRLRFMRVSGFGLVFYSATITLAAIDWVMSLDAVWYSTIFGMIYMVGQTLSAMAFCLIVLVALAKYEPFRSILRKTELHDNGKLLLAFVMLFTYLSFSQFIIIWSANLTEEIPWYLARVRNGWRPIIVTIFLIHFVVPFLLLLNRNLKKQGPQLAKVALLLLFARVLELYWEVVPNFADAAWPNPVGTLAHAFRWTDIVVPLAMISAWTALFMWELAKRPILPAYHRLVPEILEKSHGAH
jgi:hypothetical protein